MSCRLLHTAVVAAVAVAAVLGSTVHAAVAPAPALSVDAGAAVGSRLSFSGTGFVLPSPTSCEVEADAALTAVGCTVNGFSTFSAAVLPPPGYPMAQVDVPSDAAAGSYLVRICVPTCASPWGGQSSGAVVVESADVGDPDGGAGQEAPDGGAEVPPTEDPPTEEPPTDGPGGGEPRLAPPAAPLVRPVADVVDTLRTRPNPAAPGSTVIVGAPSLPSVGIACVAQWDGDPADHTCTTGDGGVVTGDIAVPAEAAGELRALVVCLPTCDDPVGGRAAADVAVSSVGPDDPANPENNGTDEPATGQDPVNDVSTRAIATPSDGSAGVPELLLLGGGFVGLLFLAGLVLRLTWRRPPSAAPPQAAVALRVIPDAHPAVTTTLADAGHAGRPLRLRAIADRAPTISLEVRP